MSVDKLRYFNTTGLCKYGQKVDPLFTYLHLPKDGIAEKQ